MPWARGGVEYKAAVEGVCLWSSKKAGRIFADEFLKGSFDPSRSGTISWVLNN